MQTIQFESSPYYLFLCVLLGIGYAWLLYRAKHHWSATINTLLFILRSILAALIAFLLLGPIVNLSTHFFEKPAVVFLVDNSISVKESIDSIRRKKIMDELTLVRKKIDQNGYQSMLKNLSNNPVETIHFDHRTSDLASSIRTLINEYEGKNLAQIVLVSDGLYNNGLSPLYAPVAVPISTIGLGDTTVHADLILKNISYNKITYQGNKFPLQAELLVNNLPNRPITISVFQNGKLIEQKTQNSLTHSFLSVDFLLTATEKGMIRLEVIVDAVDGEVSVKNNRASIFVEVIEGKKKILLIAPSPHPDIKTIRSVIETNANYEFFMHIPGITEVTPSVLNPKAVELVIFHQVLDRARKTTSLYQSFQNSAAAQLLIVGPQSDLSQFQAQHIPLSFETTNQWDAITPIPNTAFYGFHFPENSSDRLAHYPPIQIPLGKVTYPAYATVLLSQRIGSIETNRPLWLIWQAEKHKVAAFLGDGLWRWRLSEFKDTNDTSVFDHILASLLQYLCTPDDQKKFKSFPLQSEFVDSSPIVIESQVYNDIFEPVYGNNVTIELTNEHGQTTPYQYTIGPNDTRYQIGGLKEGVYQFKSSTLINGKREEVRGHFLVTAQNIESQNLTADFGLLRKLSAQTGGRFYQANEIQNLLNAFKNNQGKSLIHVEKTSRPFIDHSWFLFFLLALVSVEWFIRKYLGAY